MPAAAPAVQPRRAASPRTPAHLAITLDIAGKSVGAHAALAETIALCLEQGIGTLTLVAPVGGEAQRAAAEFLDREREALAPQGVRVCLLGERRARLPELAEVVQAWPALSETHLTVNLVAGHDGRADVIHAVRRLAEQARMGRLGAGELTADDLERGLPTYGLPPVDLLIRTGGATTLDSYLLWQSAYAELLFLNIPWPRLGRALLQQALADYAGRCRKFGGLA
jgi:undecaprenyl diphosphate synthase